MNCYVLAVSGGVDSVVLLDMFIKRCRVTPCKLVVAHFDHGIRTDSADDAEFVGKLAEKYGLEFETRREELGPDASEATARHHRYAFLREVAKKHSAEIVTAHHIDDVIETIAINLTRGTGWRGLAVLDSGVARPLTNMTKTEIVNYAKQNKLEWREDATNQTDDYLRNRIRKHTMHLPNDQKLQLLALWSSQKDIKRQIDNLIGSLINTGPVYERGIFNGLSDAEAQEVIRYITKGRLTRPQQQKTLDAVRTFLPSKILQAGGGVDIRFTTRNFTVELVK